MELSATGRLRRNAQAEKTRTPAKSDSAGRGSVFQTRTQARSDRLNLSAQALRFLDEQNRRVQERLQKQEEEQAKESSELDILARSLKTMSKCERIFARVTAGDKVPPEDLQYLRRNDPDGYKLALAMRKPKKNPKKYKSVLDDEDRKQLSGGETSAAKESSAEAAAPAEAPSGGGEE